MNRRVWRSDFDPIQKLEKLQQKKKRSTNWYLTNVSSIFMTCKQLQTTKCLKIDTLLMSWWTK